VSELQPATEDEGEIVVTGTRIASEIITSGGWYIHYASFLPVSFLNLFEQPQGEEVARVVSISIINGDVVVRLPGYEFGLKVPAADWADMSRDQRGAFIKMMSEFQESPKLLEALNHLAEHNVSEVIVRFDDMIHQVGANPIPWPGDDKGAISYLAEPGSRGVDIRNGTAVVITINSDVVRSAREFATTLAHEFRHPVVPGFEGIDEGPVEHDGKQIWSDIFDTPNSTERSGQDYLDGVTFIGSKHADAVTGSSASDTLTGLFGNDVLNGAAGDDLVLGGGGMDRLTGGTGTNVVMGGLDADTYVPAAGVTLELVSDSGGVDRLDLGRFSIANASFNRYDDTLVITLQGTSVETVEVQDQWSGAAKVEQFTFAEGTYAASYIEGLAGGGEFVCSVCDPYSPTACEHFAMPVVLDLDGDGLELISAADSHARFDIDGDGRWERIGWVGADDGILALDRNGNGRIDNFSEFSFVGDFLGAATDLEGLYAYDTDGDGFLTAADDRFADFLVWRDANGNGRSEGKELFTLEELGIVSIGLERRHLTPLDGTLQANQIVGTSVFEMADGRTHLVGDVALFVQMGPPHVNSGGDILPVSSEYVGL
jgi:hypothetical protein